MWLRTRKQLLRLAVFLLYNPYVIYEIRLAWPYTVDLIDLKTWRLLARQTQLSSKLKITCPSKKKQKIFLYKWKIPRDIFVTDTKPVWVQMVLSIRPEITAILRNISVHVQTKIWRVINYQMYKMNICLKSIKSLERFSTIRKERIMAKLSFPNQLLMNGYLRAITGWTWHRKHVS